MTLAATEQKRVSVGIGQLVVSKDAREILVAYGLGSCIGVTVWDPQAQVGGLVHVLLPDSEGRRVEDKEPARFADTGIDMLVAKVTEAGGSVRRLTVKIAGGAAVLGPANAEKFKIGERNAEAIRERLKKHGLRPDAADTGGAKGRTLEMHMATGKTYVRTAASPASEL
ncbi:MAG: chemotaxis protein CheD [Dehalococcoidia bacterium]|nr:chemotaxis protein CheD [Dehalococcoidia bacterium]